MVAFIDRQPLTVFSLFSPQAEVLVQASQWAQQASRFFQAELHFVQQFSVVAPLPKEFSFELDVKHKNQHVHEEYTRVCITTYLMHDADEWFVDAHRAAIAMGGAGFDRLLEKTQRIWQVQTKLVKGSDTRIPLVVAGVVSSIFLAPILSPDRLSLFGVKTAKIKLEAMQWL